MQKLPITAQGYQDMLDEIERLKTKERPAVIAAIAEARSHGDLSENADYDAARDKQGFIEAKLKDLEHKISKSEIVDPMKAKPGIVSFGMYVKLEDEETGEEVKYRIVSEYESDITKKHISYTSPVARSLMGRAQGDSVEVNTPKGNKYYEIISISTSP